MVVLVNTWLDFEVFTTHHIQPREEKLVVTRADGTAAPGVRAQRRAGGLEYAQLIGVPVAALDHRAFAAAPAGGAASASSTTCGRSSRSTLT